MVTQWFGVYAETDLDQPTDYSLRYAEDDTDEDEKQNSDYFAETEQAFVPEDTVKTYCTEGTPYETPFNFSTATSMSDLRVDEAKESDVSKKTVLKNVQVDNKDAESTFEPTTEESNSQIVPNNDSESPKNVSERSSDQVSPEKSDDKYCEGVVDKEGKMVTFGGEDHYAEQTPLMFSRCSSLGSLGGFEQHSIHDDRSSVVSDFSWRTSGIISPSELPDSPTQTVPPSPRHHKSQSEFVVRAQDEASKLPAQRLLNGRSIVAKRSVFEDDIAAFKEESTPIEFSAATSLSSLTIDDEPKIASESKMKENSDKLEEVIPEEKEENIPQLETADEIKIIEPEEVSDVEDDEGMLAACINIGMRSIINRKDESKAPINNNTAEVVETVDTDQETDGDEDDEDMLAACINIGMRSTFRNRKEDQKGSVTSEVASVTEVVDVEEEISDVDDDEGMLAACINIGIQRVMNRQEDQIALKAEVECVTEAENTNKISDVDSDGEDMLNACINIGIQSTHGQTLRRNNNLQKPAQPVSNLTRYQTSSALNHLDGGAKLPSSGNQIPVLRSVKTGSEDAAILDSIHIYCTEDTPANISPAGSHSNLSALSMLSSPGRTEKRNEPPRIAEAAVETSNLLSIDSLTLSEDDDAIVAKLIESGMRKVQLNGSPTTTAVALSVVNETEPEKPCSTPATSPAESVCDKNKKAILRLRSPDDNRAVGITNEATTSATNDLTNGECKVSETGLSSPESRCSFGGEFASSFEEQEQALLDLCIISGMRKCRHDEDFVT